jgi:hypothetical protein
MASFVRLNGTTISTAESTSTISSTWTDVVDYINVPDPVYGSGSDGDATISANTSLTEDKFYTNLTIADSVTVSTNGYRLFVRNVLTLGSGATIGYTTGYSTAGTLGQGGATATSVTHSLGGASATQTATAPTAALGGSLYYQQPLQAVRGWAVSAASPTPTFLRGGAGGASGAGGGVVLVVARYITVTSGTAYISAPGTAGSGGGGGGVVLIISSDTSLNAAVSTVVTGGTGCASGTVYYMQVG